MTVRLNIIAGPPADKSRDREAMELFLSEAEAYVVCGGSTAAMASAYLEKPLELEPDYPETGLMSYGYIGDFVVSEGVVTLCAVSEYLEGKRPLPAKKTGAGKLIELLLAADSIRIIFGTAVNPLHFGEKSFSRKKKSLDVIKAELEKTGKKVEIIKF